MWLPGGQVGHAAGQTTVNTTIGFFDVTPILVYGQPPTYRISLPTPTANPTAPAAGNVVFVNGTISSSSGAVALVNFALSAATLNPVCTSTACGNVRSPPSSVLHLKLFMMPKLFSTKLNSTELFGRPALQLLPAMKVCLKIRSAENRCEGHYLHVKDSGHDGSAAGSMPLRCPW